MLFGFGCLFVVLMVNSIFLNFVLLVCIYYYYFECYLYGFDCGLDFDL